MIPQKVLDDFDYKAYFFYQRPVLDQSWTDEQVIDKELAAFKMGLQIGFKTANPPKTFLQKLFG